MALRGRCTNYIPRSMQDRDVRRAKQQSEKRTSALLLWLTESAGNAGSTAGHREKACQRDGPKRPRWTSDRRAECGIDFQYFRSVHLHTHLDSMTLETSVKHSAFSRAGWRVFIFYNVEENISCIQKTDSKKTMYFYGAQVPLNNQNMAPFAIQCVGTRLCVSRHCILWTSSPHHLHRRCR